MGLTPHPTPTRQPVRGALWRRGTGPSGQVPSYHKRSLGVTTPTLLLPNEVTPT